MPIAPMPTSFSTPADGTAAAAAVERAATRLRARAWGLASGTAAGLGLAIATLVLVVRGGDPVGPHLGLLGVYLPGDTMSLGGAVVGVVWAFGIGGAGGWLIGTLYAAFRRPR